MCRPQDVLEGFSAQGTPAFALFGRMAGLPLAGTSPNKGSSLAAGMCANRSPT